MPKGLSKKKAKKILKDGKVRGHKLSKKQIGFFGAVAGGNAKGNSAKSGRVRSYRHK